MFCEKLVVRNSDENDLVQIAAIHRNAFGRDGEARLARELILSTTPTLSLVADCDDSVIGHVLLSEISAPMRAMMLAPLAVNSNFRELQVGSTLVRNALKSAEQLGIDAIFVLGDPLYYERFGFSSPKADPFAIKWQGPHFMVVELSENVLASKSGKLGVSEAFASL